MPQQLHQPIYLLHNQPYIPILTQRQLLKTHEEAKTPCRIKQSELGRNIEEPVSGITARNRMKLSSLRQYFQISRKLEKPKSLYNDAMVLDVYRLKVGYQWVELTLPPFHYMCDGYIL